MRKKRFDKKMVFMLAPALACSLAAGVHEANADSTVLADGTYLTIETNPNLPWEIIANDSLTLLSGAVFDATDSNNAVLVGTVGPATGVSITNYGEIYADDAAAILVDATATGTVISNQVDGVISVYGSSNAVTAIHFAGDLDASLTNAGTISATSTANNSSSATATAYGIRVDSLSGTLTNTGNITATADAVAGSGSAYASANGIDTGTLSGSLSNIGIITVTATATNTSDYYATASATGINTGILSGSLSNIGKITVTATATNTGSDSASATAAGIATLAITGSLTNSGTITALAEATTVDSGEASAFAYGLFIDGDVTGTLTNSGTITATATAYSDAYDVYAEAYGIEMGNLTGTLTNDLNITATATVTSGLTTGSSNTAYAYGIYMGDITGTLTNNGNITANATATNYATDYSANAYAYGIYMGNLISVTTLNNNGTIKAIASASQLGTGSESAQATAYGISMGTLSGTLNNSGTISASATAISDNYTASATAYGISSGDVSGTLTNSSTGIISATATAKSLSSASATAYGISMGDLSGTLTNEGTIAATASAQGIDYYGYAYAYGINMDIIASNGYLENSGFITATATNQVENSWAGAYAYGIYMNDLDGTLINSGTIAATALAISAAPGTASYPSASASAFGIYLNNLNSVLTLDNMGTISATATVQANNDEMTAAGAYAYGISMQDLDGRLTNSDTISATATVTTLGSGAEAEAYGIRAANIGTGITTGTTPTGEGNIAFSSIYSGNLVNTGTIIATATANGATASAAAYGVYVSGAMDGVIDNAGIIAGIADIPENGYSIYANNGSGAVNNYTGALLSGNLNLGGTISLSNYGTVALPVMEGKTTAYVGGDYTQTEDGMLSFDATRLSNDPLDPVNYGRLYVDGTATFASNAALHVNLIPGNNIPVGTTLTNVVSAYTDLVVDTTTSTSAFTVTDNSALLAFSYVIDGSTVDLTMNQVSAAGMTGAAGWGSAVGAAGALDYMLGVYGTEDEFTEMHDFLARLRAMETDAQVAQTIVTTLPSLRLELSQLTLENSHKNVDFTRQRDDVARGMSSGSSIASNSNLWIGTFGSWANQDSADGAFGYDADTFGVMLGGDVAWGSRARIGLGLAFHKSDVDGDTLAEQSADIKSYQPMLYGSYLLDDQVDIKWHLGYGWHDNETTRFIPLYGATVKGDYDASSINAGVAVSKPYKMDEKTTFTPSVRLDYAYIDNDSYNENTASSLAGPLSLRVGSSDVDQLILGLDGKIDHALNQDWKVAARLGVGYDMIADEDSLTAAYAGAPGVAFSTYGTEPSSFLYRGGLGVTYGQKDSLQVSLNYDLEGREDFTNQSVSLKLGFNF